MEKVGYCYDASDIISVADNYYRKEKYTDMTKQGSRAAGQQGAAGIFFSPADKKEQQTYCSLYYLRKEVLIMSYQEIAKSMIDRLPEDKMIFVINMLEGLGEMSGLNLYPDFKPNATTIAAMAETDEMIRTGSGQHFEGTTEELFAQILEE